MSVHSVHVGAPNNEFWGLVDELFLLNSSYAQRWLSLVLRTKQVIEVTIEDIRSLMLIEEAEYPQKSDLIRRVFYEPVEEVNSSTSFTIHFGYLHNSRKPIHGFCIYKTRDNVRKSLGEALGAEHLTQIAKEYGLPDSYYLLAAQHPLTVAALFQANRDIKTGKVRIHTSPHFYMKRVVDNSVAFLEPVLDFI